MPKNMFQAYLDNQHRRYPDLHLRPATTCDFPEMARMASKVFQHERDLDYFDKHRRVKMAEEAEADWIDKLLKREREWRHTDIRLSYERPGRHFILATYTRKPAGFMTVSRHQAQAREQVLGWAEWQDPGQTPAPPEHRSIRGLPCLKPAGFDTAIRGLALVHSRMPLLVLPNGLSVNMFDALRSFDRADAENHEAWDRWSTELLPMCLGQNGDVDGKNLVLRSFVIDDTYWDDVVGRRLLEWGMYQACTNGWTIQTVTSAISVSTSSSFREVGFVEVDRLGIFQDVQIHLKWRQPLPREPWKRPLESEDSGPRKRLAVSPRPLCAAEANEKQDCELWVFSPVA